ncbi:MAG: fibronectin type III domain-containing protein [bacterium]
MQGGTQNILVKIGGFTASLALAAFCLFVPNSAEAAVARVKTVTGSNNGATTVAATWPGATTAGNLLVAIIAVRGGTGTTITPPGGLGWTLAGARANNGTTIGTAIYYIANAASQSGASTWTLTSAKATLTLVEYSGVVTATALDVTSTTVGSGTAGNSGQTAATAFAGEVSVGAISVASSGGTWSAPTNSYTLVSQVASTSGVATTRHNTGFFEKIPAATAQEQVMATSAANAAWAGVIATFKPRIVTVGVTAGSMIATADSGATAKTANDPACTSAAACAAFTMSVNAGTATVTSVMITETGTVNASSDLSNAKLYYDTDGNYANGTTGQFDGTVASFTTETANFAGGSLAMTSGTTYYFYIVYDVKSSAPTYPQAGETIDFQIAANTDVIVTNGTVTGAPQTFSGNSTILPDATGVSYPTSPDGGISGQSVTVSGYGFGVASAGANRANCTTATVDIGCVKFIVGGTTNVASGDITAWSNTSITFTVNAALASNGGASSIEIRGANQADATPLTFYVYPNITSLAALGTNAGREYAATDTDGLIYAIGDHFGAAGTVTILGSAATQHGVVEGTCVASGYSSTATCLEIPTAISDSTYTGNLVLTRTSDSKTFTFANVRILPRILTNSPVSGVVGATVQILGNHFCETGTCPVTPNRSTVSDHVNFDSVQALDADFQNLTGSGTCAGSGAAWTHTEICINVPAGTTGSAPSQVISNTYSSNTKAFSVVSTAPNTPVITPAAARGQFKLDGTTAISIGGTTPQASVVFKADLSAGTSIAMALQIEKQPVGTSFTCTSGNCVAAVEGTIGGGGACASCASLAGATLTIGSITDNSYHWQARAKNTATNEYSAWIAFGGNLESQADFIVDTAGPAITNLSCGVPGTNDATITWDTSLEASSSQVQYNQTGTFGASCSGDCSTLDPTLVFSHSVALSNLASGATYYFRARSSDAGGNETVSSTQSCATQAVGNNPSRAVVYFVTGRDSTLGAGGTESATFSIPSPENSVSVKSAWIRVEGITSGTGTNNVTVQVNAQASQTFVLPALVETQFVILYQVQAANLYLNDTPSINTLTVTPSISTDLLTASATVLYSYTP